MIALTAVGSRTKHVTARVVAKQRAVQVLSYALVVALVIVMVASMAVVRPARATDPGGNGRILFTSFNKSHPESPRIRFLTKNGQLRTLRCGETDEIIKDVQAVEWFADGRRLLIEDVGVAEEENCLEGHSPWILDVSTGALTSVIGQPSSMPPGYDPEDLQYSRMILRSPLTVAPDGTRAATYCVDSCFWAIQDSWPPPPGIWEVGLDGSYERAIREFSWGNYRYVSELDWSPDGNLIAFVWNAGKYKAHLKTIRPDGTGLKKLASGVHIDAIDWSPDGRRILFVRSYENRDRRELWVIGRGGRGEAKLFAGDYLMSPSWSPNGRKIVFRFSRNKSKLDRRRELFVMKANGKRIRPLYDGDKLWDADPLWQPCPGPDPCPAIR